jgi:APA family basic amino acid/polyamine antiporter
LAESEKVYTRKASGLVREISAHEVLNYTLLSAGPLFFFTYAILLLPAQYVGGDMAIALLILLPVLLCLAYNTSMLGAAMPRAGGDYVFGSRIVHPVWGLVPSASVLLSFIVGIGTLPPIAMEFFLAPSLQTSFPNSALATSIANALSSNVVEVGIGILLIGVGYALVASSTRSWFWMIKILQYGTLITLIALIGTLVASTNSGFQNSLNSYSSQYNASYSKILSAAQTQGWSAPTFSLAATIAIVIFSLFFLAAPLSVYFGGEVKEAKRSLPIGLIGGMSLAWVLAMAAVLAWFNVFPNNFMSALVTISTSSAYTLPFPLSVNYLIQILTGSPTLAFLIGLGITLNVIGFTISPMLPASRILFSWSFDRLIPQKFATVNSRTHTPLFSYLVLAVLTIIVLIASIYTSIVTALFATTLLVAIAFTPNGFTAALLPFRRKDVFEKAPAMVRRKIGPVPVLVITGLIQGVGLAAFLVMMLLFFPATAGGPVNATTLSVVIAVIVFAIVLYPIARSYHNRKEGIDIGWAYKEMPPV